MRKITAILGYGRKNIASHFTYPSDVVNAAYSISLSRAGCLPFLVPATENPEIIRDTIKAVDAILIPGGADVDPSLYGEEPAYSEETSLKNDNFQIMAIREAISQGKPVFGICRGMQVINVALGGSLYQDLEKEMEGSIRHTCYEKPESPAHDLKLESSGFLSLLLGKREMKVNSLHHQGIKRLAEGLKVAAFSPDGLIEAVENREKRIYAVQYHPEALAMADDGDSKALFSFFSSIIGDR